jgi:hypothetical protein
MPEFPDSADTANLSNQDASFDPSRQDNASSPLSPDNPVPEATQRGVISRILPSAIALWLRSQTEHIEALQIDIQGRDRQILTGKISQVSLSAQQAIYQGLHLSQIRLLAQNIRLNLGQVIRGQPLQILDVIPVQGRLSLTEADLNASLQAPLLADAIADFLVNLLQSGHALDDLEADLEAKPTAKLNLKDPQMQIGHQQLTLSTQLVTASGKTPVVIRTGLSLANPSTLQLDHPLWLPRPQAKRGFPLDDLDGYQIDLGTDVALQELILEPGQLICQGRINVIPEPSHSAS